MNQCCDSAPKTCLCDAIAGFTNSEAIKDHISKLNLYELLSLSLIQSHNMNISKALVEH